MLLYCKHSGQLCNRLWSLVPAVAFALKHKATLHVLFANEDYLRNFGEIKKNKHVKFWLTNKKWHKKRLMQWFENFSERKGREIHGELDLIKKTGFGFRFINGWEHRNDVSYISEYKNQIRELFAFDPAVRKKVDDFLEDFDGVTIGVHVRRGDYRQWRDGKYYFDDETYARIMLSLKCQVAEKLQKRCRFIVCTNGTYNHYNSALDIMQMPGTDAITEICALSECDYIVGPPSTYSQWASFMGDTPLNFILNADEMPRIEDFSPIVLMNTFGNGRKLIDIVDEKSFIVA